MIKVDIPVPNGFLYFVRQYPKSVKGVYQRELPGSTVSGIPTAGTPISELHDAEDGSEGTLLKFRENGQDVLFRLLKHGYEGAGSLVQRVDAAANMQLNSSGTNVLTPGSSGFSWMNGDYKNSLEDAVKTKIVKVLIPQLVGGGNTSLSELETDVFILSHTEYGLEDSSTPNCGEALGYFNSNERRKAMYNGSAIRQFTRSPYRNDSVYVVVVDTNGAKFSNSVSVQLGIRPCFVLPSTFSFSPDPNPDGSYSPIR